MSISESVLESLKQLSAEDQQKVLAYIRTLPTQSSTDIPRKDPRGMFQQHGIRISKEEIDEARREMWHSFPREVPFGEAQ